MSLNPPIRNIVLIGMPGAGKSTVGVILAKMAAMGFVDTDLLLQASEGRSLQEIVDQEGFMALRAIEERVLLGLDLQGHVIATGGSAVYSEAAMGHLKGAGVVVFLDAAAETLERRIQDFATRGIARRPDQSFAELYGERLALYHRYADIRIDCAGLTQEAVCARIIRALDGGKA
ncbi:shikimate kinase [Desulfatiglans anilini]|uniref:shikimate kinase n=1 Tax=Desulfatiglans anilini TaxID=90728 RepID=UPI00040F4620|nr:shikimate kinase [Desulfatiglans anilini]